MARTDLLEDMPWLQREPGQLVSRGHPAGDFLEAYAWKVLEEVPGRLVIEAHVADSVRNPLGQVFGGFTPTYVDLVAPFAVLAAQSRADEDLPDLLATSSMRIDYLEPLVGPHFRIESTAIKQRGRNHWVETRFIDADQLAVYSLTTLHAIPRRPG